jgi:PAS domain S-box-containing protein
MTLPNKVVRPSATPALSRLLSDSALSRAALGSCGLPVALLDATAKDHPLTYINAAFASYFGFAESEALGRPVAKLLLKGDGTLVHRVLESPGDRWELSAWGKDGEVRYVEITVAPLRSSDGQLTHWVVACSDRSEVERLRAEVDRLKSYGAQRARTSQQPAMELNAAD